MPQGHGLYVQNGWRCTASPAGTRTGPPQPLGLRPRPPPFPLGLEATRPFFGLIFCVSLGVAGREPEASRGRREPRPPSSDSRKAASGDTCS